MPLHVYKSEVWLELGLYHLIYHGVPEHYLTTDQQTTHNLLPKVCGNFLFKHATYGGCTESSTCLEVTVGTVVNVGC